MNQPTLLSIPFAESGLKNEIPNVRGVSDPANSAAYTDGFPPVTMQPPEIGGLAPQGEDVNGILNAITQHTVFQNKGGRYKFDTDFATVIGGYPIGAVLMSDDNLKSFVCISNDNFNNPNSNMSGWQVFSSVAVNPAFIGMPFPYPLSSAPAGWITMAGQVINPTTSPKLASLYGANLPDLRGLVIRGWDNGRGLDAGRTLGSWLSYQNDAIRNITGSFGEMLGVNSTASGAFTSTNIGAGVVIASANQRVNITFNPSLVVPTAAENRMKNLAFNYITPQG